LLHALRASHGDELWRVEVDHRTSWPSVLVSGGRVLTNTDSKVLAFDASSGRQIWSAELNVAEISRLPTGALAEADGIVYTAVWNNGRGLGTVVALDSNTGGILWSFDMRGAGVFTPTVANGVVYVVGWEDKRLYGLDAKTGQPLWSYELPANGNTPAVIASGKLYVAAGKTLLVFSRQEQTQTTPVATLTTPTTTPQPPATRTTTETTTFIQPTTTTTTPATILSPETKKTQPQITTTQTTTTDKPSPSTNLTIIDTTLLIIAVAVTVVAVLTAALLLRRRI